MLLNALIALLAILIPVIWASKAKGYGLFSAFLASICTIAAGAIAFAVWEPVVYGVLLKVTGAGFFPELVRDNAWGLGLLLPFLLSQLVLRLVVDSLVKANLEFSETINFAGGLVFGAVVGVISLGMLTLSFSFFRLPPTLMGYTPIEEKNGLPVYSSSLWIPVDRVTTWLYEHLGSGAFTTGTPLALAHPSVYQQAHMQRMTFKGASRNTLAPGQFNVLGRYAVTGTLDSLVSDTFLGARKQSVVYPDGVTSPSEGATLQGYVITFESSAKEKGGNVIVTPAQVRLIVELEEGGAMGLHPIAVVAPPEAGALALYRFRFDAPESYIASVGGGSEATFAFEFILPRGAVPTGLLVKNARVDVGAEAGLKERPFAAAGDRDAAVRDRSIFAHFGAKAGPGGAQPLDASQAQVVTASGGGFPEIETGDSLPDGLSFSSQNAGGLSLGEGNAIVEGEQQLTKEATEVRGLDRNLRVDKFQTSKDTGLVKIRLSQDGARSLYGKSVEAAEQILPPLLIDSNGTQYEAIGYVYKEGSIVRIRYMPGEPLRALAQIPALSRTKRDQTLWLIFRPTKGVKIVSFALGSKEMARFAGAGVTVQ